MPALLTPVKSKPSSSRTGAPGACSTASTRRCSAAGASTTTTCASTSSATRFATSTGRRPPDTAARWSSAGSPAGPDGPVRRRHRSRHGRPDQQRRTQVGGRDHPGRHARVPRPAPRRPRRPRRGRPGVDARVCGAGPGGAPGAAAARHPDAHHARVAEEQAARPARVRRYALPAAAPLVVVADEHELPESDVNLVRRLHAQHEILWVEDADPTSAGHGDTAVDVGRTSFSPPRCGSTGGCTTRTPRP